VNNASTLVIKMYLMPLKAFHCLNYHKPNCIMGDALLTPLMKITRNAECIN